MNRLLWIVQVMLALLFLFAGTMKFVMTAEQLTAASDMPVWFLRFIGVCEILGALGLILPGIFRTRPGLTPLAAAGLVIIMIGATVTTVAAMGPALAVLPAVSGLLAASVAYGRWRVAPLAARRPAAQRAEAGFTTSH
jgi:uncharacterized membrane protein YphA (DoxX/SURF4 family)